MSLLRRILRAAWLTSLLAVLATGALAAPLASIVEGSATLIRKTQRYKLQEGSVLQAEDLIESGDGAFVQIEFDDGLIVGLQGPSRWWMQPRWAPGKRSTAARGYLLEGWAKVAQRAKVPSSDVLLSERFELAMQGATAVLAVRRDEAAVFMEGGSARWTSREGSAAPLTVKTNEFLSQRAGAKPLVAARPSADFMQRVPPVFRDRLPERAAAAAARRVVLKPLGEVSYDDIEAWLTAERGVRGALLPRWQPRLSDRAFRSDVDAHLGALPEWSPLLHPERHEPRPAQAGSAATRAVMPVLPALPASTPTH